jgi:hypothetical protein
MKPIAPFAWALVLIAVTASAGSADVFRSATAGFEVTKPAEWTFISAEQNLENIKRTEIKDKEFHAAMVKYATAPLVAMTKYPEPFDDLNPSLKVNIRPFGPIKGMAPTKIMNVLVSQFEKVFQEFVLVEAPRPVKVAGIESGYMKINFSMQTADGRKFATTSELWIVPRGDYYFMIGAGTRQDEKTGSRKEIQAIVDTIRFSD